MRNEFSRTTKRRILERSGGFCEGLVDVVTRRFVVATDIRTTPMLCRCFAPLEGGRWHADHVNPDWISNRRDITNAQALCIPCHVEKTKYDQALIAKIKRVRDRHAGIKKSRSSFPTNRDGPFKKKMSGRVERR